MVEVFELLSVALGDSALTVVALSSRAAFLGGAE